MYDKADWTVSTSAPSSPAEAMIAEPTATDAPAEGNADFAALDRAAEAYAEAAGALRAALREDLLLQAAPVARRVARRYRNRGEALEDLEQVAVVGLLKAVDGYDPVRGPFSGYFLATVSGELKKHFRDRGWAMRVPRRTKELVGQVMQATARTIAEEARRPTTAELAEELAVSEAEIGDALAATSAYRPASINAAVPGDDATEVGDLLGALDAEMGRVEDRLTVAELLCRMPPRERRMLAMRFYGNHTQTEIAEALGMSQMHASRLLAQALAWLRDALLSDDPVHWKAGRGAPEVDRLAVETSLVPGAVVVTVGGELDRDSADQLRRALRTAVRLGHSGGELRIDLREVPFVDAAAIAAIIGARELTGRAGMRLRLVGARHHVARMLATCGLWPYLGTSPAVPAQASGPAPGHPGAASRHRGDGGPAAGGVARYGVPKAGAVPAGAASSGAGAGRSGAPPG